jgi:hypothetical protein
MTNSEIVPNLSHKEWKEQHLTTDISPAYPQRSYRKSATSEAAKSPETGNKQQNPSTHGNYRGPHLAATITLFSK